MTSMIVPRLVKLETTEIVDVPPLVEQMLWAVTKGRIHKDESRRVTYAERLHEEIVLGK